VGSESDEISDGHSIDLEDVDEDEQQKIMEKRQEVRFGKQGVNDVKLGNCLRITFSVILIIMIPIQVFLKSTLQTYENDIIISLQSRVTDGAWYLKLISFFFIDIFSSTATLLSGVLLYLMTDSLLAFKSLLLYAFGIYIF
jgi:hypothetical protein